LLVIGLLNAHAQSQSSLCGRLACFFSIYILVNFVMFAFARLVSAVWRERLDKKEEEPGLDIASGKLGYFCCCQRTSVAQDKASITN
jgi:hypothetical protein